MLDQQEAKHVSWRQKEDKQWGWGRGVEHTGSWVAYDRYANVVHLLQEAMESLG